jgi:hypothetical protein
MRTDHLRVQLGELGQRVVKGEDLRRTDEREVHWVEQQDYPDAMQILVPGSEYAIEGATLTTCRDSPGERYL